MKKRILSALLALCMTLALLPAEALAEEMAMEEEDAGPAWLADTQSDLIPYPVGGGNLYFRSDLKSIYFCDDSVTSAVIPSSINGVAVTGIWSQAFMNCAQLESVSLPDSIKSIGDYAFAGCDSLKGITIPDSVVNIGKSALSPCKNLENVTISGHITSIESHTFSGCSNLKNVIIPDSVTSIGDWAFQNCTSLSNIDIPDHVTYIGEYAFCQCYSLESITIPSGVVNIGDCTFSICKLLTNVVIPNGVTGIGQYAFQACDNMTNITLPDSVTSIGYKAFWHCSNLEDVYYSGSESEWANIDIDDYDGNGGNYPLTSADIHYNSTGPDTPAPSPIYFAQDTCSVKENDLISVSVSVPNSNSLTAGAMNFNCTSSDEDVVLVTSWKGPDIDLPEMNPMPFTVFVKGVNAGTAAITASVGDGRSASCAVTVTERAQAAEFDPDIYHADWLRTKSTAIRDLERNTPGKLLQDPYSKFANNFWSAFSAVLSAPSDLYETAEYFSGLSKRDLYEALLLDALQASVSYDKTTKILKDGSGYAKKLLKYITEGIKEEYRLDMSNVEDYRKAAEQTDIEEIIEGYTDTWFKENHLGLSTASDAAKYFSTGMKLVGSAEEFGEYLTACMALAVMDEQTRDLLNQAYTICLENQSYGPGHPLTLALADCILMYQSGSQGVWQSLASGGLKIAGKAGISYLSGKIWEVTLAKVGLSNPNTALILAAISAGKTLTGLYFKTDDVAEKYLDMVYMTDIEEIFDLVYADADAKFAAARDVKSANLLLEAMRLSFQLRDRDCEAASAFQDSLNSGVLFKLLASWGINGWSGIASETKESIKVFQDSYRTALYGAETGWIHRLEEDYPGSGRYEQYEHLIEESFQTLTKELKVRCPVNVYVYDQNDVLAAWAEVGHVHCTADDLVIAVEGEEKTVCILNDASYRIECVGYDGGTMDIAVTEYSEGEAVTRSVNYNALSVKDGGVYSMEVDSQILTGSYVLKDAGDSEVSFDYDSMEETGAGHTVKIVSGTVRQFGKDLTETTAVCGEVMELSALVPERYGFIKWHCTGGTVEIKDPGAERTSFVMPDEDVEITAVLLIPPGTYRIQFDANGGPVTPVQLRTGPDGRLRSLPAVDLTRRGWSFDGWFTAAEGGERAAENQIYTEHTTLYAHWIRSDILVESLDVTGGFTRIGLDLPPSFPGQGVQVLAARFETGKMTAVLMGGGAPEDGVVEFPGSVAWNQGWTLFFLHPENESPLCRPVVLTR